MTYTTIIQKYPKIFPSTWTDLGIGEGWNSIIACLCSNAQHHIDYSRKTRKNVLHYNRALVASIKSGSIDPLIRYHDPKLAHWAVKYAQADFDKNTPKTVPDACPQISVVQIKEKFGTLRFYYDGGDEKISTMVEMAESMSGYMCDSCGSPASTSSAKGWLSTRCESCSSPENKA